ncbi:MAG TPA: choice-of-anchor D domain-containing protein [Terriglobales bacterium]|nr:choice-of-anchor D domain-containing protein [Terriglobales bacterium]
MNRNTLKQFVGAGMLLALVLVCFAPANAQFAGVLTQHNDVARTGQNPNETILTPANVNSATFGKLFSYSVDGQIYAQPLYVPNVNIPSLGVHNVVYVETQNDSLYAFDADGLQSTPLFQVSFINPAAGILPVPCKSDGNTDISCGVYPIYGINSTPVVDPTTNTIYLVTRTWNTGLNKFYQTLHALDITTGAEKFNGPLNISGGVAGTGAGSKNGIIYWDPLADVQRAGLLELNGAIYVGWAGAQHGWIMGFSAANVTKHFATFNTTPNAQLGGVWAAGNGLAADPAGNIYAAVGDALFDASTGGADYGDSLIQLNAHLQVEQYFTPSDQSCRSGSDLDLGSGGPMVLPGLDELLVFGKGGAPCDSDPVAARMYLLSTQTLGGYNGTTDASLEDVIGAPGGYWSSPAYWSGQNSSGQDVAFVYSAGTGTTPSNGDYLKMFSVGSNGLLSTTPYAQSSNTFPSGATPSTSSNGATDGIVWAIARPEAIGVQPGIGAAVLYAYDAANTTSGTMNLLYSSTQAIAGGVYRDRGGCANKFQVPTIANGKVYVATQNELDVFGLLGTQSGPGVYFGNPCYTFAATVIGTPVSEPMSMIDNGTAALTVSSIAITGTNAADFTQTNTCSSLAVGKKCVITVTFTPSLAAVETAYVTVTDNAVGSPHNIYLVGVGKK